MKSYYHKYLKYKIKYNMLKNIYGGNINELFKNRINSAILSLELSHDVDKNKLISDKYYDLLNLEILNNFVFVNDPELFIKDKILEFNNTNIENGINQYFGKLSNDEKQKISDINLTDYILFVDNKQDTTTIKNKLKKIFGIDKYQTTFIYQAEKLLTDKTTDFNQFIINGILPDKYLLEGLLIGLDPINFNKIINFNIFNDIKLENLNSKPNNFKKLIAELNKILIIVKNMREIFRKHKNKKIFKDHYNFYIKIKFFSLISIIEDLLESVDDTDTFIESYNSNDMLTSIIFSIKETRDSFYIKEIKESSYANKIFLTTDKISSYRCILNGISTINIYNGFISFIAIFNNNKLRIIGNPFNIYDDNTEYYSDQKTITNMKNIINNPVLYFRQIAGNLLDHNKANVLEYDLNNYVQFIKINDDKMKEIFMKYKELSEYIDSYDDLYNIINVIKYKVGKGVTNILNRILYVLQNKDIQTIRFIVTMIPLHYVNYILMINKELLLFDNYQYIYNKYFGTLDNFENNKQLLHHIFFNLGGN